MKVFISKPSILSSSGYNETFLKDVTCGNRTLKEQDIYNQKFVVGRICSDLLEKKYSNNPRFKTRTNDMAISAILPLKEEIEKLIQKYGKDQIGVVIGSTTTGVEENFQIFKNGYFEIEKFSLRKNSLGNPADCIKEFFGLRSVSYGISTACTSGLKALSEAKDLVESGICKAVIAGGVDSLNTLTLFGFNSLGILSSSFCDPFSTLRNGTNLGEGAAFFIVGSDEVGEIQLKSVVTNCDAYNMTQPRQDGFYQTKLILQALKEANLQSVDYINLHGTGTQANDIMETNAIFSSNLKCPCSGIKQYIGHTLGAAGAIETALCALILGESALPLQITQSGFDETLAPICFVRDNKKRKINNAINLSFAFGGDNACAVLGVCDD